MSHWLDSVDETSHKTGFFKLKSHFVAWGMQASQCLDKNKPCATDRYISFEGIDCDCNARQVMELIEKRVSQSGESNAFWDYFMKKQAGGSGPRPDDLFLIHSNINQVRELFESSQDDDAINLLEQLEEECC